MFRGFQTAFRAERRNWTAPFPIVRRSPFRAVPQISISAAENSIVARWWFVGRETRRRKERESNRAFVGENGESIRESTDICGSERRQAGCPLSAGRAAHGARTTLAALGLDRGQRVRPLASLRFWPANSRRAAEFPDTGPGGPPDIVTLHPPANIGVASPHTNKGPRALPVTSHSKDRLQALLSRVVLKRAIFPKPGSGVSRLDPAVDGQVTDHSRFDFMKAPASLFGRGEVS